jgi:hypothetical protein
VVALQRGTIVGRRAHIRIDDTNLDHHRCPTGRCGDLHGNSDKSGRSRYIRPCYAIFDGSPYANTDVRTHADGDPYAHSDTKPHLHVREPNAYAIPYILAVSHAHANTDVRTHADGDPYAHSDTKPHPHVREPNAYAIPYILAVSHAHANTDVRTHADGDPYAHSDTNADFVANPNIWSVCCANNRRSTNAADNKHRWNSNFLGSCDWDTSFQLPMEFQRDGHSWRH